MMQLLVFCNPENRRVDFLQNAAAHSGWTIKPVAYERLIAGDVNLEAESRDCNAVRIESPGENFTVERKLLARGAELGAARGLATLPADAAIRLEYELGRIHFPNQYFLGFADLLDEMDVRLPTVHWMNSPHAVKTMFDKPATTARLQENGIPTPRQLGFVVSFERLHELLVQQKLKRVFVKLATSSSASGVLAIVRQGDRYRATTTVEMVKSRSGEPLLYNSLKLQHLSDKKDIASLVDSLVPHQIFAEEWVPKAAYDHRSTFDIRVVVIDGTATHFVPRVSSSPLTNLHLGNRRGGWNLIRDRLGDRLDGFLQTCTQAVQTIPGAFYAGLDIVVDPTYKKFYVLEANACGDLLPGITNADGDDTYSTQLKQLLKRIDVT